MLRDLMNFLTMPSRLIAGKSTAAKRVRATLLSAVVVTIGSTSSMVVANTEIDFEWPCIQGYVPEVAIAVVWPEPIEEDVVGTWLKNKEVKNLVNELGKLEVFDDDARARIEVFAESIPEEQRIDTYNQVADGVVYRFNQRRSEYFKGIRKYTRQQIVISEQVQEHLNELVELEDKTDVDSLNRAAEIRETTAWQQRIFDRRESSIRLLCETPVELETVMGDVLRDLAQYLPF